ncbi:heme peroxidase [Xylaria sp. CBS 124048]|nr:heme peroxidase [Xylaria sp. CBS 124048]
MRWTTHFLPAVLSAGTLARADPTWPSQIDELEEIMYQVQGYRSRQFGGTVIPCSSEASGPGRHNAAEWLRSAFHDMATSTIAGGPRKGGMDGSLQFELASLDNIGSAFNSTLRFMADYYTSKSSVADLLALGVYYAVRSCGGPAVPIAAGRIDAKAGGPIGVPLPQNSAFTFLQQFERMGFNQTEMIQAVACGHSIGGVHDTNFPQIVPLGSTADGEAPTDSTVDVFDNKVVTEYISGNTSNPLVVGPSIKATRNSDFKVFNSDGNVTVAGMADTETYNSICARVLRKMIEVVPDGVVLTDPIEPYAVKPVDMQLTLNPGASTLQLSGVIRVRTTDFGSDAPKSVLLTYKDRNGGNTCGQSGCTYTADLLGATQGFDDTFVWFPINAQIPASSGISSFTLAVNMNSGISTVYDNNGNSYPMKDDIFVQKPQSCLLDGNLTVMAAVRNDLTAQSVNLHISYKTAFADPNRPIPQLNNATMDMVKVACADLYTFYSARYSGLGDLAHATKIDVVSGSGAAASRDDFKAASDVAATCPAFDYPPNGLCSRGDEPPPPVETSSTITPTVTSSETATLTGTVTSTSAVGTPYLRKNVGNYTLVGCNTEPTAIGVRALSGASFAYDGMTLESCMGNCTGSYYWGTEYGRECYCGDKINPGSSNVTLSECSMVCSGDSTEYCGAGDRLELYVTTGIIPTPTGTLAIKPTVQPYERIGCYEELPTRALTGGDLASDSMTLELCAKDCSGFTYFATEYSRECYCGNSIDPRSNVTADADCNMACVGDQTEYCGGSNRLELYRLIHPPTSTLVIPTPTITPTNKPTVSAYGFQGCWTEGGDGLRALDAAETAGNVTLESCASFCQAYHYFGTEFGRECHCGNVLGASSNQTELSDCNMPCTGDPTEFCGASNRLNLYYANTTVGPSQPSIVSTYSWYGCQTETIGIRALASKTLVQGNMSLDVCATFCLGSTYFGTEYGDECYCGDELGEGSMAAPSTECSMACSGNGTQLCGAGNRLSVYKLTALTPSRPNT